MNIEAIIVGLVITVSGGLLLAFVLWMIGFARKVVLRKPLPKPEDHAVFLNNPKNLLKDACLGRDKILKEVFSTIKGEEPCLFVGNHISIIGVEGIGKTLICQRIFSDYLLYSKVYTGWIECNGNQSIFDIISTTFSDSHFRRKSKNNVLKTIANLDKPCVLFIDQVDHHIPIDDLKELSTCPNITLIISGSLTKIDFINDSFTIPPLPSKYIRIIFEEKADSYIDLMPYKDRSNINVLIYEYIKGNPFLASAFACAEFHNNNKWEDIVKNMRSREYEYDNNYLKAILRQLYKINQLKDEEKSTLSKLALFPHLEFVKAVFDWYLIPKECVDSLCKTYWITQEDSVLYSMDETHRKVLNKVLIFNDNLNDVIDSIQRYIESWGLYEDKGFRWLSVYVEDTLKKVKGYNPDLLQDKLFATFACTVAEQYEYTIGDDEKCLEWLELCNPSDSRQAFDKAYCEFQAKFLLLNSPFTSSEVEQAYFDAFEKSELLSSKDSREMKQSLIIEYCGFLISDKQYSRVIALCKEYFDIFGFDLNVKHSCDMFFRYISAANESNDKVILSSLVNDKNILCLIQNQNASMTAAWSIGELGKIYKMWGNEKLADIYTRQFVTLVNKHRCFLHHDIKTILKMSDGDFAEYMHSHDELIESLEEALLREDAEALYIEGRYQEKHNNFDEAFELYEKAATKDSLRGICSLALMCYKGKGEPRNYDKARKYWDYGCAREHRGSYYWLGILLLDEKYDGCNKELSLQFLTKAAELGSKLAKQKILEI